MDEIKWYGGYKTYLVMLGLFRAEVMVTFDGLAGGAVLEMMFAERIGSKCWPLLAGRGVGVLTCGANEGAFWTTGAGGGVGAGAEVGGGAAAATGGGGCGCGCD